MTIQGSWNAKQRDYAVNEKFPCPVCGSLTVTVMSCPGYGKSGKVMVCYPPESCGNAVEFHCTDADCPWWVREPRGERSDVSRMGVTPEWLEEASRYWLYWDVDDEEPAPPLRRSERSRKLVRLPKDDDDEDSGAFTVVVRS